MRPGVGNRSSPLAGIHPENTKHRPMLNRFSSHSLASRLVRCLSEMGISGAPTLPDHFSDQVGSLLGLTGSVTLSKMLGELSRPAFKPTEATPAAIREAFMVERSALVRDIVKRFKIGDGPKRNRLPGANAFHANCMHTDAFSMGGGEAAPNCAAAFAPYRKQYVAIQNRLDHSCQRLRSKTAQSIAGLSPALAGLAALDRGLGDVLVHRQQQVLSRIPSLLESRFNHLLCKHWQVFPAGPEAADLAAWMVPEGWVTLFCRGMQDMLMAELEFRLQPVLGLIESMAQNNGAVR